MSAIRVMLVDDSAIVRRIVSIAVNQSDQCSVVYAAKHGQDAIDNIAKYQPDVVILDVQMPQLDGIDTLRAIRRVDWQTPVLMFSALTSSGAAATELALAAGANGYVEKPCNLNSLDDVVKDLSARLLPKLTALVSKNHSAQTSSEEHNEVQHLPSTRPEIIAIGASTGGPRALSRLLSMLDESFSTPILIAQHMPAVFTELLATQLDGVCALPVREASHGERVLPGQVWVAKGGRHLRIAHDGVYPRLEISRTPADTIAWPSVNELFNSVATRYGKHSLGLVLTGMGRDGLDGAGAIVQHGGTVLSQNEATCSVWGMPRVVMEAGLAKSAQSIKQLAKTLNACERLPMEQPSA